VLFLRQFSDKGLEYIRTWIGDGIYGMSHSVDQSGTVEGFLVQNIAQILADFIFIIPVTDVLFQIVKHTLYLDIGAAVLWPL